MIQPKEFFDNLISEGILFFSGVPDSLLKNFCAYVTDHVDDRHHVIAANEGGAVALAAGYYLATGNYALVYMQNSGLGNATNPLLSLADPEVYSIPMLLMIGWRGEPGIHDEPQHVKQGRVTLGLLEAMEIPYLVLDGNTRDWRGLVRSLCDQMRDHERPVAIVVRTDTFDEYKMGTFDDDSSLLMREEAISIVVERIGDNDIVVSTTGKTSRELFEVRERYSQGHGRDFLTVGSMGHSSQIALGIALQKPNYRVICLDGDGAVLMHAGALAIVGQKAPPNFVHIVINNESHDSVGGQPTASPNVDYVDFAQAMGYRNALRAATSKEIESALAQLLDSEGPSLLEIKTRKGSRQDLGRPTITPLENRNELMRRLLW
ncbi:MAG TPA: phosphonopyruvate decarboxylase [Bacillota bacterium]|nr:phosphonopyruvate decarboxylase [Bacillota bacterium]